MSKKKRKQRKQHNVFFCIKCAVKHQNTHPQHIISVSERRAGSFSRLITLMGNPKLNCLDDDLLLQIKTKCLRYEDEHLVLSDDGRVEEKKQHTHESENVAAESCTYGIETGTPPTTAKITQNNKTFPTSYGEYNCNESGDGELDIKRSVVHRLL